ncbi:DNA-binding transcriptional regulator CytR [Paractinoplanes rishiriensis]|uniref:DNA-binding transcriptional regulator CytR n=2 Tax=Paractinoplanes rishiriensis TaxID=1050105 RepID=A0A919JYD9_9ACTN|nr:DNA-binding transcriptional regulator CytR [Actinoplanes rishiriensis]
MADVARHAGVSLATASRALSARPHVAPATRARVLAAAERLAYVISPEASRLAGGRTDRIAVVVPHLSRWFFGALLEGLEAVLREAGLDVLLYHAGNFFQRLPARRKVDAVVVVGMPVAEPERARLELMGVHVVAAGGQVESYPYVSIDDTAAGRQAVDHLLFLKHRRIGMIATVEPGLPGWPARPGRTEAYHRAIAEAGLPDDPGLVVTVPWGGINGADAMDRLLSLREPPTAVYAHSDEVALGAMRTLRRAGLRIPEDVSVVGIDDHPLADLADLTTVAQPVYDQGSLAGRMVLSLLAGDPPGAGITVPTRLVIRGSTAPPGR